VSQENVESYRRAIDAFNRRDPDGIMEFATADVEWIPAMGSIDSGGSFQGRAGVEAYLDSLREAWDELEICPDEFRDVGDSTLMLGRLQGRGSGSGVTVDAQIGGVSDWREGKVWRIRTFYDHAEALKAVGLGE
jgi:ketosteroid isomerase-like protein